MTLHDDDTTRPSEAERADLNTGPPPDRVEEPGADHDALPKSPQPSARREPDPPAGGDEDEEKFNVEISEARHATPSSGSEGKGSKAEEEPALRPDIQKAMLAGQNAGAEICRALKEAAEAKTNAAGAKEEAAEVEGRHYADVVASAVFLLHTMNDKERDEFFRRRGVRSTSYMRKKNPPLHFIQALFSPDKEDRKNHAPKLSGWSKIARGIDEGLRRGPDPKEIQESLLGKHNGTSGRTLALAACQDLPDVRNSREQKEARMAERNGQGEGGEKAEDRPDPEKTFKNLSALGEDDLSWIEPEEIARALAPGLDVIAHQGRVRLVVADGNPRTVGRVTIDDGDEGCTLVLELAESEAA